MFTANADRNTGADGNAANADSNASTNFNTDADSNAGTNRNINADTDSNTNADSNATKYTNADSNSAGAANADKYAGYSGVATGYYWGPATDTIPHPASGSKGQSACGG